jgi:hypothetical protein
MEQVFPFDREQWDPGNAIRMGIRGKGEYVHSWAR